MQGQAECGRLHPHCAAGRMNGIVLATHFCARALFDSSRRRVGAGLGTRPLRRRREKRAGMKPALTKERRRRSADRRNSYWPRHARRVLPLVCAWGAARANPGALIYRRSAAALARGLSPLSLSFRPGFLGRGRQFAFARRALPAPACPSPEKAPPAPAVVPAGMMPKTARERSVWLRARAPHSLRIREYPRPKASVDERDSFECA